MKVECEISYIELTGDYGNSIPSVCATCSKCGMVTENFGTGEASIKRCLVLLREECDENNFYVGDV
jgi:hypothetical protein